MQATTTPAHAVLIAVHRALDVRRQAGGYQQMAHARRVLLATAALIGLVWLGQQMTLAIGAVPGTAPW